MISPAQGLALVRIAFGLYLIMSALSKTQQGWFTNGGPLSQTLQQTLPRADPFYRAFLEGTVLPNVNLFAQLAWIIHQGRTMTACRHPALPPLTSGWRATGCRTSS